MTFLYLFFLFGCGLILGSFANVLIDRRQRGEKIDGRSCCDFCGYQLAWYDNIPVLSFLFLGGKCRKCGRKLSWQYPIVEFGTGLLFLFVGLKFGGDFFALDLWLIVEILYFLLIAFLLLVIFVWDLKYMLIPDELVVLGIGSSLIYLFFKQFTSSCSWLDPNCFFLEALFGGLVVFGFFLLLFVFSKGKWIGGGDVKLGFLLGIVVGWRESYMFLLLAYVVGALVSLILVAKNKKNLHSKIPFGPFLIVATWIVLFFGEKLLQWYWGLFT
ncbi:MAG: prepilin peptidase [Patescibacteria group bacterium]|nr:prepilin peptidase [Patescibacteria group bacterium]